MTDRSVSSFYTTLDIKKISVTCTHIRIKKKAIAFMNTVYKSRTGHEVLTKYFLFFCDPYNLDDVTSSRLHKLSHLLQNC